MPPVPQTPEHDLDAAAAPVVVLVVSGVASPDFGLEIQSPMALACRASLNQAASFARCTACCPIHKRRARLKIAAYWGGQNDSPYTSRLSPRVLQRLLGGYDCKRATRSSVE